MALYERLFHRLWQRRELRPMDRGDGAALRPARLGTAVCVPARDARDAVLAAS